MSAPAARPVPDDPMAPEPVAVQERERRPGFLRATWAQFARSRLNVLSAAMVAALALVGVFADFIASDMPIAMRWKGELYVFPNLIPEASRPPELRRHSPASLRASLEEGDWALLTPIGRGPLDIDVTRRLQPPNATELLGTDSIGRSVAARVVHGARISLAVGVVAVAIYVAIGILLGALAGYFRGWVDAVVSRLVEVMMVFPTFFLILAILGIVERPTIWHVMVVIGLTGWPGVARLIRGEILRVRELDYVAAIRALGGTDLRIVLRHVIPNSIGPVFVAATFGIAGAILTESGLSFLGFGTPPPTASWGELLTQAYEHAITSGAWWLTLFPGLAIFLTVTAYNLVGEGLRDAMDPRLRR